MKQKGFTLIELLIVVAIIGILAAIAVPNFLNAQTRAKTARSVSDIKMITTQVSILHMDRNLWLIDGNDSDGTPKCSFDSNVFIGKQPSRTNIKVLQGDNHFNGQIYKPLTTPISYISAIPTDPFSQGLFYSYEDWGCSNNGGYHGLLAACGPDGDNGDWHPDMSAIAYQASNGVASNGDIWYVWSFKEGVSNGEFRTYYKHDGWGAQY